MPPSRSERTEPNAPFEAPEPGRPRVLVVDDSVTVRRLLARLLERHGCEVTAVATCLEALGEVGNATPDLVFLDVGLPHLDGTLICRTLKRSECAHRVPVVLLTGHEGPLDRLRGSVAGASAYLTKPVDPQALIEVVDLHLSRSGRKQEGSC